MPLLAQTRHSVSSTWLELPDVCNKAGAGRPTENYPKNFYARGHQLPNYYWKAVLKVKRVDGEIVDATTIGFWLPHKDLKGHSYVNYTVSVDQIEQWQEFVSF